MKTKKTKKRRTLDPIKEIEFEIKTCEAEALDKHGPKSSVVAEWRSIIRELERMRKTYGDARLRRTFGKGIPESAFREFRRSAAERARAAHSIEATP